MKTKLVLALLLMLTAASLAFAQPILSENFDGTWPQPGWYVDSTQRVGVSVTQPYSMPYCIYFNVNTDKLRTPLLTEPGYLTFWHKYQYAAYPSDFWVQVGPTVSGPWTPVAYIWAAANWTQATVDLRQYSNVYVRFSLYSSTAKCDKYMFIDGATITRDDTLPVELSSFTASLEQVDESNNVKLRWTTLSETQLSGYNVFRGETAVADNALQLSTSMINANNTSNTSNYEFVDNNVETGCWYYWLQSNDLSGTVEMHGPISVNINAGNNQGLTPGLGMTTQLLSAYPNPFNLRTVIPFQVISKSNVKLDIYNQKGQLVWQYNKSGADIGLYQVDWNGRDMNGKALSSGVYFCRMTGDNYIGTKKLVYQK